MTSQIKESWSLLCQLCICHNIIIIYDSIYRPNKCMAYDGKRVFTEHSYVQNNLYELFLRKLHSSNKIFKKLLKTRPWDHWWTNISQPVLPDTIPEIHKCRHMLERGCWVCWGHHLGATLSSVSVMVSFPCIQLISICSEALGWSIGTIWPASWTYVLWHGTNLIKSEYEVTNTLREREREREKPWGKWEAHGSLAILLLHHQLQMEQLGMPQTVFVLTIPWHEPTLNSLPKEKRN